MSTMICFRAAGAAYCVPLQATLAVRTSANLILLPDPATGVAGIIPGDPPLTVISPLTSDGSYILVIEAPDQTFGLLVDVVTGLRQFDDGEIQPAPRGQGRPFISGTVDADGHLVFVADPTALAGRL